MQTFDAKAFEPKLLKAWVGFVVMACNHYDTKFLPTILVNADYNGVERRQRMIATLVQHASDKLTFKGGSYRPTYTDGKIQLLAAQRPELTLSMPQFEAKFMPAFVGQDGKEYASAMEVTLLPAGCTTFNDTCIRLKVVVDTEGNFEKLSLYVPKAINILGEDESLDLDEEKYAKVEKTMTIFSQNPGLARIAPEFIKLCLHFYAENDEHSKDLKRLKFIFGQK